MTFYEKHILKEIFFAMIFSFDNILFTYKSEFKYISIVGTVCLDVVFYFRSVSTNQITTNSPVLCCPMKSQNFRVILYNSLVYSCTQPKPI